MVASSVVSANELQVSALNNFDSGNWSFKAGDYSIGFDHVSVRSDKSNPKAILSADVIEDSTFRATLISDGNFHWAGILGKQGYRLIVNNQFRRIELQVKKSNVWKTVKSVQGYRIYLSDIRSFELRLTFKGNVVFGFLDGKQLFHYNIKTNENIAGTYGLVSGWNSQLTWKNVLLENYADLTELKKEGKGSANSDHLVEVSYVRSSRVDGIYFDGERPEINFRLRALVDEDLQIEMKSELIDVLGNIIHEKLFLFNSKVEKEVEFNHSFSVERLGSYKLAIYKKGNKGKWQWLEDISGFSVLPKIAFDNIKKDSYFGGHIDGINYSWHLDAIKKLGIRWVRAHDGLQTAWWSRVQPKGEKEWMWPYDKIQKTLKQRGFETLAGILWTPRWASKAPINSKRPQTYKPRDLKLFSNFIEQTGSHYQDDIKYWEVWNEPHHKGYWNGTPQEYVDLLRVAYEALHNTQEDVFVLGGGGLPAGKIDWIERMLQAGAAEYMDGFSIHYLDPNTASENISSLREVLNKYGFSGPIWNTEDSVPSTSFLDQLRAGNMESNARYHFRNACYELVRMYMENIAAGIEKIFYYQQVDPWRRGEHAKARVSEKKISGGMWDEGRTLKPIGMAHAAMVYMLDGQRFVQMLKNKKSKVFIFRGDNVATAVQYAEYDSYQKESRISLLLPQNITIDRLEEVDFMGNRLNIVYENDRINLTISREPRYIRLIGKDADKNLRELYESSGFRSEVN